MPFTAPPAGLVLLHGDPAAFSWTRWEIHPSVLIGCALLAAAYLLAVGPMRRELGVAEPVDRRRAAAFLGGIAVLFVALNGPLHDLSDYFLFSAHMVQHMLLMMVMPPLLLLGMPAWLLRAMLLRRGIEPAARVLTHHATAFAVYNVILIGWHFPQFYNWALVNHDVHIVQHLMFMVAAVLMWWPVVDPLPELRRMGPLLKMLYIFAFGIPMSVVSAFITMSGDAVYPWYVEAPRMFGLSPIEDQQLGGLLMWIPGMIVYWTVVTVIFLRYSAREEREEPGAGTTRAGEWVSATR